MNVKLNQVVIILCLSIFLSFLRYLFLEDFNIIKRKKIDLNNQKINFSTVDSLKNYINSIDKPQIIDIDIAKLLYDNSMVTFLDARDVDSYNEEHIAGAINLPFDIIDSISDEYDLMYYFTDLHGDNFKEVITVESNNPFIIGIYNKNVFIKSGSNINEPIYENEMVFVIYCSGKGCSLSEDLAFYLYENMQIKKIFIYEGGIPEWIENKYPVK